VKDAGTAFSFLAVTFTMRTVSCIVPFSTVLDPVIVREFSVMGLPVDCDIANEIGPVDESHAAVSRTALAIRASHE
jgi:hypothetical protein